MNMLTNDLDPNATYTDPNTGEVFTGETLAAYWPNMLIHIDNDGNFAFA